MIAEAVGGWWTKLTRTHRRCRPHADRCRGSHADHCFAIWFAERPATSKKTYGYYRLEILAAFVNGIALVLLSIWIIYEAIQRWQSPPQIAATPLTIIAVGGLDREYNRRLPSSFGS
jgi:cobalt-zinc-cadmium efflux system protein